jgi:hypothetical protein
MIFFRQRNANVAKLLSEKNGSYLISNGPMYYIYVGMYYVSM